MFKTMELGGKTTWSDSYNPWASILSVEITQLWAETQL